MNWLLYIFLFVGAFVGMEGVAWFTHKYVMHGFMWVWHKSHHHPYEGVFERNDLFSVVFSLPAIVCIVVGLEYRENWLFLVPIGAGITGYGLFYFLFHDILVHRRVKHSIRPENKYLRRLIRAHKMHHKHTQKEEGEAFGFLFAPKKYEVD
ncbi:beta-carotene 3-hydroxylase [Flexibacter flexilis DSM 6793]|uniref:Beta-carotene 3-hydroxylase n=1 Tax=Flexibacter flexilis DSM 6793 TaxID=927664 RepID=A0A1I1G3H2_9BACT|nr:sterol desaturase family protein [Flexibacter flexilis]SFC05836.1 beta-carotene 3-hydroxylase [Flexibacter flexilis DSM 6793]